MTFHEARIRAGAIWGADRLVQVTVLDDGGAIVQLQPTARWAPDGDGLGAREWGYTYHELGADGLPTCHAACQPDPKDR